MRDDLVMRNGLLAACAVLVLAGPSWAAGFLYDCNIVDHERSRGWISSKIAIVFPNDEAVQIVDALILHFVKKPIRGTVVRENAKRLIVKWTVDDVVADSGRRFAGFNYRASISKATGKVEVRALPSGYDRGALRGTGTCTKRTG